MKSLLLEVVGVKCYIPTDGKVTKTLWEILEVSRLLRVTPRGPAYEFTLGCNDTKCFLCAITNQFEDLVPPSWVPVKNLNWVLSLSSILLERVLRLSEVLICQSLTASQWHSQN